VKLPFSWRRLLALCRKESLQILRDPSSHVMAFAMPVVLLLIFGYGINLDSTAIRVGLLLGETSGEARRFADGFFGSPYLRVRPMESREALSRALTAGEIRGFVVVEEDFSSRLNRREETAPVQVVTDGAEPNVASFVENYSRGAWQLWLRQRASDLGRKLPPQIDIESRIWFNPAARSRYFLVPGSVTIIMTVIGALLTSLVVAREWERGTMEALLASPANRIEIVASKLLPYYVLGIVSFLVCIAVAVFVIGVPFRGSLPVLLLVSTLFLFSVMGMGLWVSTVLRNQFNAAMTTLNLAFLPAMMLSGFIYEIQSMPWPIRAVTYLVPARYFVGSLQTLFLAGDVWPILIRNVLFLAGSSALFIVLTYRATRTRLD